MMQINLKPYDEEFTVGMKSFVSLNQYAVDRDLIQRVNSICRLKSVSLPQCIKKTFGDPRAEVDYGEKYYIWTFSKGNATVNLLINEKEASWECDSRSVATEITYLYRDIVTAVERRFGILAESA